MYSKLKDYFSYYFFAFKIGDISFLSLAFLEVPYRSKKGRQLFFNIFANESKF